MLEYALTQEYGILIAVDELSTPMDAKTARAKQILYRWKKAKPEFRDLVIKFAPQDPNNLLWIYPGSKFADTASAIDQGDLSDPQALDPSDDDALVFNS